MEKRLVWAVLLPSSGAKDEVVQFSALSLLAFA